jgi:cytidylate kinase
VGKGTLARKIAEVYGFAALDTGSLYRAVTLHLARQGFDLDTVDEETATAEIKKISDDHSILSYSKDPGIRSPLVDRYVSVFAQFQKMREVIKQYQINFGRNPPPLADGSPAKGAVVEGRDICTVIFPNAPLKIYLDTSTEEKASRRVKQYAERGIEISFEEVLANQQERDLKDHERTDAALRAADIHVIDNSGLQKEQTFELAQKLIKENLGL